MSADRPLRPDYDNAFWDGTQLVFGDGDGQVFERFTKPVDVLGHELTHAVTEHTAGLVYRASPGRSTSRSPTSSPPASSSGCSARRRREADWLIGAGLFLPGIQARALRDMAAPGTAYDDPALGKDPQVGHMDDYVDTTDDNGGVHLNSGIPNRAFQLAATAIGGTSWEGAGRIWYAALTGGAVAARTDFAGFAAATVAAAGEHARRRRARPGQTVGVTPGAVAAGPGQPPPAAGRRRRRPGAPYRRVRRADAEGEVDLDGDDPRGPEVADLVDRIDLRAVGRRRPASRTGSSTPSTSAATARPCPSSTSPPTCAGSPSWCSSLACGPLGPEARRRLRQRPVQGGGDVQRRAREDREVGVGLVDEQLELGAAEDDAAGAGVPELVDEPDDAAPGASSTWPCTSSS